MKGFPDDFLWGVACASYQCEGGWDADGKGRSIWDDFSHDTGKGHVKNDDTGDVACDCYHRFAEDIALMKRLGVKAYRFSVSWPRVLPEGVGACNEKGLKYYDALIDACIENGIEPWVTLYHWDLPSALEAKGGWMNRATADAFGAYAELLSKRFSGRVRHYMTLNEPACIIGLGYGIGVLAPGLKLSEAEQAKGMFHLALAHSAAQRAIKSNSPAGTQVGVVCCGRLCYPLTETAENLDAAYDATFAMPENDWSFTFSALMDPLMLGRYGEKSAACLRGLESSMPKSDWALMEKPDFLGVNVYNGIGVDESGAAAYRYPGFPLTATKWPVTPEVMRYAPAILYRRYGLPMYITENGQSANDRVFLDGKVHDPERIDYLHRYLSALKMGVAEGAPVRGYLEWSFLDNFEWAQGYDERFGIVYVDYRTQARIPKDSFDWFAETIRQNGGNL